MPARLQLHLAVVLFGAAGLMGKLIALSAMQLVLGRTLIGALALALFMTLFSQSEQGRWWALPGRVDHLTRLVMSGLVLACHWWTFFHAIQLAGVGVAIVGFSAFPVFVTLLEAGLQGRRVQAMDGLTTAMVVLGLWLVAPTISWQNTAFQGLAWGVISGALFAVLALLNKTLVLVFGGLRLGFWQQALAAVCCCLLVDTDSLVISRQDGIYLLLLGCLLTAVPHVLFIACLKQVRAHTAALVTSLEPVYAIAFAWLLLAEQPSLTTLAGAAVILAAVVLGHWHQNTLKASY
ncbi:MAG: DMT family transporter [Gammaproteobacteria bacterium]|jgi:drug/metabolite transporter (DMT)-like permease|nr:DMT family transporter [Gammaproteobacteria bacterium]